MKIITKGVTVRSGGVKHPPGSTIDIDDDAAARLIARGCAIETPAELVAIEVEPDGKMSPEIAGDGTGESLPEAPPGPIASPAPAKPKRGKA